jgi:hypothetical protein
VRARLVARGARLVVLALTFGGCAGSLETVTELPKAPRRPDGVVLEPVPALPAALDRAPASGIVALRVPLADKDVEELVRAYVRAFEREDLEALVQLLAEEAAPLGRAGARSQLVELWRARMKSFEYQRLGGVEVAQIAKLERYGFDATGGAGAPERPPSMRPGDLYVRVPIATPRVGSDQLFGDVLVLLLRREDGRLKIAGQADESGRGP